MMGRSLFYWSCSLNQSCDQKFINVGGAKSDDVFTLVRFSSLALNGAARIKPH